MKKFIVLALALVMFAAPAFAGEYNSTDAPIVVPGGEPAAGDVISVLSNNVTANVVSSDTSFAAVTAHNSGSKQFGSSSDSTKIYSNPFELNVTNLTDVTASDSSSFSGWTTL
ncbi:hypothetical protein [Sulfuriflexus sp.]|uniref:hypothetical protein n=1 Tax=Sulfuriflexus sp. TaxID=2015443 RepID=UPI0028CC4B84|nr:hypothetical protein [Sulfuriflexus sp.]MDT8405406.1 hypothetical protein [Sulfuriflexus sp.]